MMQVRLNDLLAKWAEALPKWRAEAAMRDLIETEVKRVMTATIPKVAKGAKTPAQVGYATVIDQTAVQGSCEPVCPVQVKANVKHEYEAVRGILREKLPVSAGVLRGPWLTYERC